MIAATPNPTTDRQPTVSLPAGRPIHAVGLDVYSTVISGTDSDGTYALSDCHVPPGGGPPPHAHGFEEMFYVLEGEIDFFCHDQRVTLGAAAAITIPGWAPHTFRNLGTGPGRVLVIVAPAGLEAMLAEIGVPVETRTAVVPPPSPEEMEAFTARMPEVLDRYQTRFLPPDTFDHLMP